MIITTQLQMDFSKNIPGHICAKQGDANSRRVTLRLYDKGIPWTIPENAAALIRYQCLPGGSGGVYDTLEDGSSAWTISGNELSVILIPRMLAEAGTAMMDIMLLEGDRALATYNIHIHVEASPLEGAATQQTDYFNVAKITAAYDGVRQALAQASGAIATAKATAAAMPGIIGQWLAAHPELTTPVADGAITPEKTSFIQYQQRQLADIYEPNFVNQIPIATDADGNQMAPVLDVCLSASTDSTLSCPGFGTTGFIPLTGAGDILRFQGMKFYEKYACRIAFYRPDKTYIGTVNGLAIPGDAAFTGRYTQDSDGNFVSIDLTGLENSYASDLGATVGYLRLSAESLYSLAVLTVNEEITYTILPGPTELFDLRLDKAIAVPQAEENAAAIAALTERVAALETLAGV